MVVSMLPDRLVKNTGKLCVVLLFLLVFSASLFVSIKPAFDSDLQYRQLANGWVSFFADIYLNNEYSFVEKVQLAVNDDLKHGRFRPLFFVYTSAAYALSPIVHGRLHELKEGKAYADLVNGDLMIVTYMLAVSVVISMTVMALLIYKLTGNWIVPLCSFPFIPLSPSLAENFCQTYIDSQEIPLVLFISFFLYVFFIMLVNIDKRSRSLWITCLFSAFFMGCAFLIKETSVVLTAGLGLLLFSAFFLKQNYYARKMVFNFQFMTIFLTSLIFTVTLLAIVFSHRVEYVADNTIHDFSFSFLSQTLNKWWSLAIYYSLINKYAFGVIGMISIYLFYKRKEIIFGRPIIFHLIICLFLLVVSFLFLAILVQWKQILPKYLYPCVFFYTVFFSYIISIFISYLKNNNFLKLYFFFIIIYISSMIYFYNNITIKAFSHNYYLIDLSNYGVSVIKKIAEDISRSCENNKNKLLLVGVCLNDKNKIDVGWAKIQLKRFLNFDYEYTLVKPSGKVISHGKMPGSELSNYRVFNNLDKKISITSNIKQAVKNDYDVIYCIPEHENNPVCRFVVESGKYTDTGIEILHPQRNGLPGFKVKKYSLNKAL